MKNFYKVILFVFVIFFLSCANSNSSSENTLKNCQDDKDNDNDGKKDCEDEECQIFSLCMECIDLDGDNYGVNCSAGEDCDDTSDLCIRDNCVDFDNDTILDCKDDCIDLDGDSYGNGTGCIGSDCDEDSTNCNSECIDIDHDNLYDCKDPCIDVDHDSYGIGNECLGSDCDDMTALCNTVCEDDNNNGSRDCDERCSDNDGDGYGTGEDCLGMDCDDLSIECNVDCHSDTNNNDHRDCDENCVDNDRDGYGRGEDCSEDCDDRDINNWSLCNQCRDLDNDGYYIMCNSFVTIQGPDVNDNNPNCDTDSTDNDEDGYCLNHDCDDTTSYCITDCSDNNNNGLFDCNECFTDPKELGYYNTKSNYSFNDVYVKDNYAFTVVEQEGLIVVDVSDPHNPMKISSFSGDLFVWPTRVIIRDDYAFINDIANLVILDISNIQEVNCLSTYDIYNSQDMAIKDNYLYLLKTDDESDFIQILGISNPRVLQDAGIYDIVSPDGPASIRLTGITIYNDYAFVSIQGMTGSEMKIFDISDPVSFQEIASYSDTNEYFGKVAIKDNYVYVSKLMGLEVLDISNITEPQKVSFFDFSGWCESVFIYDDFGFLICGDGVYILDITDSPNISQLSNYNSLASTYSAFYTDYHIFVADGTSGLRISSFFCDE